MGPLCVIVGSAAGALIGLQFVVMTLIAERPPLRAAEAGAAFATPTIVHFGVALLLSALLRAPWPTVTLATALCGIIGFGGAVYAVVTARRLRKQALSSRLPARVRGLAVPFPAAFGGLRHTRAIAFCGSILHARRIICCRWCSAALALHRHS
jgi:hypothetical protein